MSSAIDIANNPTEGEGSSALERLREALADKATIEARAAEQEWGRMQASKDEARVYSFIGPVRVDTCQMCMDTLGQWFREDPSRPIEVVFNSPGGSIIDGLALFDYIEFLKQQGTQINTVVLGAAASMAGVLLQAGSNRRMGPNAYLMIHEVSNVAEGSMSEIEDQTKFTRKLQDRILDILAARSNMSKDEIEDRWQRRDWWLSAEEAVELGFADSE